MKVNNKSWHERYYEQLLGAKVIQVHVHKDESDDEHYSGWPTFLVEMPDGNHMTLEVSQDEEGNGPGFIFGLPTPVGEVK